MASQFQNRLVGTLVLVSLGVIFLPDVFDGKKTHNQENFQAIPLQKEFSQDALPTTLLPPKGEDSYQPAIADLNESSDVKEKIPSQAELPMNEGYQDSAWIIRLGAFRNIENAQSLVATLRMKGYPAQLMPRQIEEGELVRVEIGPDLSKDKLASMTAGIESLTGLKGQLLRFNPFNP